MESSNKRYRVLITDVEYSSSLAEVSPRFPNFDLICGDEITDSAQNVDAVVTQSAKVDKALLDSLSNLSVVLKLGRNYSNIDAEAVRARKLVFAAVPRKGPNCVAELALTLILALSKDLLISHESVETGAYRLRGLKPTLSSQSKIAFLWMHNMRIHEVVGKTLGIVGMGEISAELARRANVMGMKTLYYKRTPLSAELEQTFSVEYRDLNTLLGESDYVCLVVPHTPETEHMIGQAELALMRPGAYLVNVCRGGVVDEAALIEALASNRIAGAGLDVYTYEPLEADSQLCDLDNVILMPHIGGGTGSSRAFELGEGLKELSRILAGEPPRLSLS